MMLELVIPAKAGGLVGDCSPTLDAGLRRHDGNFLLHRAEAIVQQRHLYRRGSLELQKMNQFRSGKDDR